MQKSCEVLARLDLRFNRTGILTGKKDFQVPQLSIILLRLPNLSWVFQLIIKLFASSSPSLERGDGHEVQCLGEQLLLSDQCCDGESQFMQESDTDHIDHTPGKEPNTGRVGQLNSYSMSYVFFYVSLSFLGEGMYKNLGGYRSGAESEKI